MHGTERLDKPGQMVSGDTEIRIIQPPKYVSRGGEKARGLYQSVSDKF